MACGTPLLSIAYVVRWTNIDKPFRGHWVLVAFDPYCTIQPWPMFYYLNPLLVETDNWPDMKVLFAEPVHEFRKDRASRKNISGIRWFNVKVPKQTNSIDCGFYVMRFIKEIIAHGLKRIHHENYIPEYQCLNYSHAKINEVKSDARKVAHLEALEGAKERLQLYEADLVKGGSFDSAVDGCECVFHTASPVVLSVNDPQTEMLDPAVNGTLNVLRSCKKVPSIKRVVITSSMASVMFNYDVEKASPDTVVDETWFSDTVFCEENKLWYHLSKTLAEKAAWKFAEENGLDLVTLHPGFVIGPLLQPTLNLSSEGLVNLIKEGKELYPDGTYRYVNVRDVALAHILAFENASASGRYCLVERVAYSSAAINILKGIFPSLNLCPNTGENQDGKPPYQVSKERAKSLGLKFTPLEVSLKDAVESLKDKNFISY